MTASGVGGRQRAGVAIGGGHGTARALAALERVVDDVCAVVTVADDGGSSGRLRRDLAVLPPGDLRMALTAIARNDALRRLVDYRFTQGELAGHSLGNLMLVALQDLAQGDPIRALQGMAELLGVPGRVLPCTTTAVTLEASSATGDVSGQAAISATPRLHRVWLDPPTPTATPQAEAAIRAADLVVLGPGSLYTSLLPNLLVPGIAAALREARGPVVLVGNLREQSGETEGLTLRDHLEVLRTHVEGLRIDTVVVHAGQKPAGGGVPLATDSQELHDLVGQVVTADLLDGHDGHDPGALASVLARLMDPP